MFQWVWESSIPPAHLLPMLLCLLAGSHGCGGQVLACSLHCPCPWLGLRVWAAQSGECGDPCLHCVHAPLHPCPWQVVCQTCRGQRTLPVVVLAG